MEPFLILPNIFVPRENASIKPPLFDYGWALNEAFLLNYAHDNHLELEPVSLPPDEEESFEDYAEEGEDKDPIREKKGGDDGEKGKDGEKDEAEAEHACSSGKQIEDRSRDSLTVGDTASPKEQVTGTQQDDQLGDPSDSSGVIIVAIDDILTKLGLERYAQLVKVGCTIIGGCGFVLSIYTNDDLLQSLPTDDDIKKMKEGLGGGGEARWYISNDRWAWE